MKDLTLLIKIPTRERSAQFFNVLNRAQRLRVLTTTRFLITLDDDDVSMNSVQSKKVLGMWGNVNYIYGKSSSKVDAVNRDMDKAGDWDIILLLSDDFYPQVQGYDRIIRDTFKKHFPDTDGVLWINDGYTGRRLNTIVCMGRAYYNRYNFIYNPVYKSLFCDNEYSDLAEQSKKFVYMDQVLFEHRHPMNVRGVPMDNLYRKNDKYFLQDKATYFSRKNK